MNDLKTLDVPGPGSYDPMKENIMKKSSSAIITPQDAQRYSQKWQTPKSSRSPGPGSYDLPSSLTNKGPSMGIRLSNGRTNAVPGPGAYTSADSNSPTRYRTATALMPSEVRFKQSKPSPEPGPGSYNAFTFKQGG